MNKHTNQHAFLHQRAKEFRKSATEAEAFLWEALKARKLAGLKFRRQHAIGPFIVDFYCHARRLLIEVDGEVHEQQRDYDEHREIWLRDEGYLVLRFSNEAVMGNTEMILEGIVVGAQELSG
jgi:very-short-patch-repair endonuclease